MERAGARTEGIGLGNPDPRAFAQASEAPARSAAPPVTSRCASQSGQV